MKLRRVGHDWVTSLHFACTYKVMHASREKINEQKQYVMGGASKRHLEKQS